MSESKEVAARRGRRRAIIITVTAVLVIAAVAVLVLVLAGGNKANMPIQPGSSTMATS